MVLSWNSRMLGALTVCSFVFSSYYCVLCSAWGRAIFVTVSCGDPAAFEETKDR